MRTGLTAVDAILAKRRRKAGPAQAALIAIDPRTGDHAWKFQQFDVSDAGILTTASDLLFTGGREGYFYALDARSGEPLWRVSLGGQIVMAPVTYMVDGRQHVAVIAGHTLLTYALRAD